MLLVRSCTTPIKRINSPEDVAPKALKRLNTNASLSLLVTIGIEGFTLGDISAILNANTIIAA